MWLYIRSEIFILLSNIDWKNILNNFILSFWEEMPQKCLCILQEYIYAVEDKVVAKFGS